MKTLKTGDRGAYVQMLQLALVRSGFLQPGGIDGIFGPVTAEALKAFQSAMGLTPDAIAGDETWAKLNNFIRGYFIYTLAPGDTLYEIAKQNYTTVRSIMMANGIVNPRNLQAGQKIKVPFGFSVVPQNIAYTYELVSLICDGLSARYPFINKSSIGKSVMGKELFLLQFGIGDNEVFINASHHANEWITTPLVLEFMEAYAAAYGNFDKIYGYEAGTLYRNSKLFMVPLVNPDGVDLVNGVVEGSYFDSAKRIAQAFPSIPFPSGWKANIVGTDPNLNYPAKWEEAKRIKYAQGFNKPAPRDFVGTAPLSAPESRAVYDFTNTRNFDITISYHTQGKEIYYKFQDLVPPRGQEIGEEFARISGYTLAEVAYNSSFAGYKDWVIQQFNIPSYTIEAGQGTNPLPLSQLPQIYNDNIGVMAYSLSI